MLSNKKEVLWAAAHSGVQTTVAENNTQWPNMTIVLAPNIIVFLFDQYANTTFGSCNGLCSNQPTSEVVVVMIKDQFFGTDYSLCSDIIRSSCLHQQDLFFCLLVFFSEIWALTLQAKQWGLFIKMATDWQVSEVGDTCRAAARPGRRRSVQIEWLSAGTAHLGFPALLSVPHLLSREIKMNRRHYDPQIHKTLRLKYIVAANTLLQQNYVRRRWNVLLRCQMTNWQVQLLENIRVWTRKMKEEENKDSEMWRVPGSTNTVRLGAEKRTFSRARLDVLNFRLRSYHVLNHVDLHCRL